jgi:lipoprotein-anchoring transpeptidase ErfK/SrfK
MVVGLGVAALATLIAASVVLGSRVWGSGTSSTALVAAGPLLAAPVAAPTTTSTVPPPQVPVSTVLATPSGSIPTYPYPGAPSNGTVGVWYGYPLVLPVIAQQAGWLEIRLPERPNQSVAWIEASRVTLSATPFRIVVHLGTERLTVYRGGYPTLDFPVGIGTPATPTVTGSYFLTVRAAPPSPGYGPFVLSTSAHSDAIQSWEGAGDAIIAIHGPITSSADARIGQPDARISNGCIRMHDADLSQLGGIPIGTPIDIEA